MTVKVQDQATVSDMEYGRLAKRVEHWEARIRYSEHHVQEALACLRQSFTP